MQLVPASKLSQTIGAQHGFLHQVLGITFDPGHAQGHTVEEAKMRHYLAFEVGLGWSSAKQHGLSTISQQIPAWDYFLAGACPLVS